MNGWKCQLDKSQCANRRCGIIRASSQHSNLATLHHTRARRPSSVLPLVPEEEEEKKREEIEGDAIMDNKTRLWLYENIMWNALSSASPLIHAQSIAKTPNIINERIERKRKHERMDATIEWCRQEKEANRKIRANYICSCVWTLAAIGHEIDAMCVRRPCEIDGRRSSMQAEQWIGKPRRYFNSLGLNHIAQSYIVAQRWWKIVIYIHCNRYSNPL